MGRNHRTALGVLAALAGAALAGCGGQGTTPTSRVPETPFVSTEIPTEIPEPTPPAGRTLNLWAQEAEASSEFAVPEWGAQQASGAPDAPGCGDYQYAWASAPSDSVETLTLFYGIAVIPVEIRVIQSFHPDQVVRIEVFNPGMQEFETVLEKDPEQVDRPCPYVLRVPVEGIDYETDRVRITVDQSQLGLGWNEIDAVELIGRQAED